MWIVFRAALKIGDTPSMTLREEFYIHKMELSYYINLNVYHRRHSREILWENLVFLGSETLVSQKRCQ